jgi:hypothetical protein
MRTYLLTNPTNHNPDQHALLPSLDSGTNDIKESHKHASSIGHAISIPVLIPGLEIEREVREEGEFALGV